MPTLVDKSLKFQANWIIRSGDISSFMGGTYKKLPCTYMINVHRVQEAILQKEFCLKKD
jgi:hypothetical protein